MWGSTIGLSCKAFDPGAELHPDLDTRDVQTCLTDQLRGVDAMASRRRRKRRCGEGSMNMESNKCSSDSEAPSSDEECQESENDHGISVSPTYEGWLVKRGSGGLRFWRQKWVTISCRRLYYASGPPARQEDGTYDKASAWMELNANTTVVEDEQNELAFAVIPAPEGKDAPNPQASALAALPGFDSGGNMGHQRSPSSDTEEEKEEVTQSMSRTDSINKIQLANGWQFRAESLRDKRKWLYKIRQCINFASWWSQLLIGPALGEGGYSQVLEIMDRETGQRLAVKFMEARRRLDRDQIVAEIGVLTLIKERIRHPNLIAPARIMVEGNRVWIMFPLCSGGDLFNQVVRRRRLSEREAAMILFHVILALQALHKHDILHLDVKPENILIGPNGPRDIRLTDFGLSRRLLCPSGEEEDSSKIPEAAPTLEETESSIEDTLTVMHREAEYLRQKRYNMIFDDRINGTIGYLSPEVVLRKHYSPAADIWGLGIVLHIMLVGYPPFHPRGPGAGSSEREALERSLRGELEFDPLDWARIQGAQDLIRRLLTVNHTERITLQEAMEHPWLVSLTQKERRMQEAAKEKALAEVEGSPHSTDEKKLPCEPRSLTAAILSAVVPPAILRRFSGQTSTPASSTSTSSSSSSVAPQG